MFARFGLASGLVAVLTSGALFLRSSLMSHLIGYALATILAFTLVATARRASIIAAADSGQPEDSRFATAARFLLVTGFLIGLAHSWVAALELSRW